MKQMSGPNRRSVRPYYRGAVYIAVGMTILSVLHAHVNGHGDRGSDPWPDLRFAVVSIPHRMIMASLDLIRLVYRIVDSRMRVLSSKRRNHSQCQVMRLKIAGRN